MPMQNQGSLVKRKIYFGKEEERGAGGTRPSASEGVIRILVLLGTFLAKAFARVAEK